MKLKMVFVALMLATLVPSFARGQSRAATLDQQKTCDAQARKRYHEGRALDGHHEEDPTGMNGYTSHFDPTMNVCYVWVRFAKLDGKFVTLADTISDAFEGRIYGSYMWFNPGKKASEVTPTACWVRPRKEDQISCKSQEEFDGLVDKYFGIGR